MSRGLTLLALLITGCFNPAPPEGLPCTDDGVCPDGQWCDLSTNTCTSSPGDGGVQLVCIAPEEACNGVCVNLSNDVANCGDCGAPCDPGELCGNGVCATDCPVELENCDDVCVDLLSDDNNCNGCGITCADDEECRAGSCEVRCDTLLTGVPELDPWGTYWDTVEREQTTLDDAISQCALIGGRLPTASELYRVRSDTGLVGESYHSNPLWSNVPFDGTQQVTIRLDTGATGQHNAGQDRYFRCICPAQPFDSFRGHHCNGPAGSECFGVGGDGGRTNMDSRDRPPLRKNSAVWECNFYGGHIAQYRTYAEAILAGVPNGSDNYLWTADDDNLSNSNTIRWSGVAQDWTVNGNISRTGHESLMGFRCAGPNYAGGVYNGTVADEFVGRTTKGEIFDTPSGYYIDANDACWAKGGHLPASTELAELILQGLPNGHGTEYLWTSDQGGYDNNNFPVMEMRWSAVDLRFAYQYAGTLSWAYKNPNNSRRSRCIYYPVDTEYAGPGNAQCQGGCTEVTLPVSGNKMWFDTTDRATAGDEVAHDTCRQAGGHLATERDLLEAIRYGSLANGSDEYLWAADIGGTLQMIVKWADVDTAYDDLWSKYMTWDYVNNSHPFRCMWTNELR